MTEHDVQKALYLRFSGGWKVAVPNAYHWRWESDLIAVTNSRYTVEYEIKLNLSDFKNDASKRYSQYRVEPGDHVKDGEWIDEDKYETLKRGAGPNRFIYVVPGGLLDPEQVPDFAGLMEFGVSRGRLIINDKAKRAKRLHSNKIGKTGMNKLLLKTYYRFWDRKVRK